MKCWQAGEGSALLGGSNYVVNRAAGTRCNQIQHLAQRVHLPASILSKGSKDEGRWGIGNKPPTQ